MPGRMHLTWQGRSLLPAVAACLALLLSGLLGLLAPKYGVLTVAPVAAGIGFGLMIWRPILGLYLAAFLAPVPWTVSSGLTSTSALPLLYLATLAALAACAVNLLFTGRPIRLDALTGAAVLFMLWEIISFLASPYSAEFSGSYGIIRQVSWALSQSIYPVLAVLAAAIATTRRAQWGIIVSVVLGCCFCAVFGPIEFARGALIFHPEVTVYSGTSLRVTSFLDAPTIYGVYLSACAALLLGLSLASWRASKAVRVLLLLAAALILVNLALTFARASWLITLGWSLAPLLVRQLRARSLPTAFVRIIATVGILAVLLVAGQGLLPTDIQDRLDTVLTIAQSDSATTREARWTEFAPAVLSDPWVGHGVAFVSDVLDPAGALGSGETPHDNFLYIALANGIPGLLLYLAVLAMAARTLFGLRGKSIGAGSAPLLWAAAGVVVAIAIAGIFESVFGHRQLQTLFWFAIGLLSVVSKDATAATSEELATPLAWPAAETVAWTPTLGGAR